MKYKNAWVEFWIWNSKFTPVTHYTYIKTDTLEEAKRELELFSRHFNQREKDDLKIVKVTFDVLPD